MHVAGVWMPRFEHGVLFPEGLGREPIGGDDGNRTRPHGVRSMVMDTASGQAIGHAFQPHFEASGGYPRGYPRCGDTPPCRAIEAAQRFWHPSTRHPKSRGPGVISRTAHAVLTLGSRRAGRATRSGRGAQGHLMVSLSLAFH